ncbi:MAG: universal stress protein [Halieaceae bacterium]|jgi:nucleotide-binding universal stress UspA family protein|nr:universal stress protein [Halieaceae bacterium]
MIRLLVPLDGSPIAEKAMLHAATFASYFEAELHLLRVVEQSSHDSDIPFDNLDWEMRCSQCECYLQNLQRTLKEQGIESSIHTVEGDPAAEILEFSRQHDIDLIMLSTHGAGGSKQFPKGSTVQKVVGNTDTSVLLVHPDTTPNHDQARYRRILVILDGSRRSDWALQLAAIIARATGAEMSLLQIVAPPAASPEVCASIEGKKLIGRLAQLNWLDAVTHLEELKSRLPSDLRVKTHVVAGSEIPLLVQQMTQADNADLMVLSADGMSAGSDWLHGSLAESILAQGSLPLLVFQELRGRDLSFKPRSTLPAASFEKEDGWRPLDRRARAS